MNIRRGIITEADDILKVLHLAHRDNNKRGIFFPSGRITKKKLLSSFKSSQIYVSLINETIVGTISIQRKKQSFELSRLAVLPNYQNQGIGKKLIKFAEDVIQKEGFSTCYLYTINEHPWLPDYYQKLGYTKVKTLKGWRYHTGKYVKKFS